MLKKLQKTKADLEKQREILENQFQQTIGAIAVCDKLIEDEENANKESKSGPDDKKS
tara:strand:+ start:204 stop:374 length:171 start_codon:yes stop_codon:yes gene_type:complete